MFQKRKPRVKVALKAVLDAGPRCERVGIEDLSETGAFVALDADVTLGDAFTLIPLDEDGLPAITVTVVRAQMPADTDVEAKRPKGVGLTFTFADAESEAQLRAFCAGQRETAVRRLRAQPRFDDAASAFEPPDSIPLAVALPRVEASFTLLPQYVVPAPVLDEMRSAAPSPTDVPHDARPAYDTRLDAVAPSAPVLFDAPPIATADTAPVASVSRPWPLREASAERRFFDEPTDVVRARPRVDEGHSTDIPRSHGTTAEDPFFTIEVMRLKRWVGALVALQLVLVAGAFAAYLDQERGHAEAGVNQGALLASLRAERDSGKEARASQAAVLESTASSVAVMAARFEDRAPAVRHRLDVERLAGTDKAAVDITRIVDNPKLRDAHVDFIRTRVFRAQIDERTASARRGLTDLQANGLTWVAMRDDIVPCPGADLAAHDLSTALQKRLAASAPHSGCGPVGAGEAYREQDLFLVSVAPKAAIQVVTDVGLRVETAEGPRALTLAARTVRIVP